MRYSRAVARSFRRLVLLPVDLLINGVVTLTASDEGGRMRQGAERVVFKYHSSGPVMVGVFLTRKVSPEVS